MLADAGDARRARARVRAPDLAPAARRAYLEPVQRVASFLVLATLLGLGCKRLDGISRDIGAACESHADCTERCLPQPRWPGGFCSLECVATRDCPVGSDCVSTADGDVCLFLCFDDRDCGFLEAPGVIAASWRCRQLPGPTPQAEVKACAPAVAVDAGAN
jgi:hypothetical protein